MNQKYPKFKKGEKMLLKMILITVSLSEYAFPMQGMLKSSNGLQGSEIAPSVSLYTHQFTTKLALPE